MLQLMQQPAPTKPYPTASDFAGLLATLAAPAPETKEDIAPWSDADLGEDVTTVSYERALRAHARYRPAERPDGLPMPAGDWGRDARREAAYNIDAVGAINATGASAKADAAPAMPMELAPDRDLRSASVTIRLSKTECAQLHQRAAEAGLTVSAYLRSCALEAEALRTQVKQVLAELKRASETARTIEPAPRRWLRWIGRFTKRRE